MEVEVEVAYALTMPAGKGICLPIYGMHFKAHAPRDWKDSFGANDLMLHDLSVVTGVVDLRSLEHLGFVRGLEQTLRLIACLV
jgi:hypothetical protein